MLDIDCLGTMALNLLLQKMRLCVRIILRAMFTTLAGFELGPFLLTHYCAECGRLRLPLPKERIQEVCEMVLLGSSWLAEAVPRNTAFKIHCGPPPGQPASPNGVFVVFGWIVGCGAVVSWVCPDGFLGVVRWILGCGRVDSWGFLWGVLGGVLGGSSGGSLGGPLGGGI